MRDGWTVGGIASRWERVGLLGGRERWMTAGCALVGSARWEMGDGWTVGGIASRWESVGLLGGRERWMTAGCAMVGSARWEVGERRVDCWRDCPNMPDRRLLRSLLHLFY